MVPDLPTFAVDQGFRYLIPDDMDPPPTVGSIVRVPLSGRRVRGYVVEVMQGSPEGLKAVLSVSGAGPVFEARHLRTLQWAAGHYVSPLAVVLDRAAPPNLPQRAAPPHRRPVPDEVTGPLAPIAHVSAAGRKQPLTAVIGSPRPDRWIGGFGPVLNRERSVMVVLATAREVERAAVTARRQYDDRVVAVAGDVPKDITGSWERAQTPGSLVIGTPRIAMWMIPRLALAVAVEEGRRAMKDRQTPTIHVRDVLMQRARVESFNLAFVGPTPTVEVLAQGPEIIRTRGRDWPPVEIIDRSSETPGGGYLAPAAVAALKAVSDRGGRSFVFTHRRQTDASQRCSACRRVRVCRRCGARVGREPVCRRCGEQPGPCLHCEGVEFEEMGTVPERLVSEVNRKAGRKLAGVHPTSLPVSVGTERDVAGLGDQDLAVVADSDSLTLGSDYRATEESLRILARVASILEGGSGRRVIIQTSMPESAVSASLVKGDAVPLLESILMDRVRDGLPPSVEMMAIELRGNPDVSVVSSELARLDRITVLGPAESTSGFRWLLQGRLGSAREALRPLVQRWRDTGYTVRIDADPIDL